MKSYRKKGISVSVVTSFLVVACSMPTPDDTSSSVEQIIGQDDRILVGSDGFEGYVAAFYKNNELVCNGAFINKTVFVTASHCLNIKDFYHEKDIYDISVFYNDYTEKFKVKNILKYNSKSDVVTLKIDGESSVFSGIYRPDTTIDADIYSIDSVNVLKSTGKIEVNKGNIFYDMDTIFGNSGSPVYQNGKIIGIHLGTCGQRNCGVTLFGKGIISENDTDESLVSAFLSHQEKEKYTKAARQYKEYVKKNPGISKEFEENLKEKAKEYEKVAKEAHFKTVRESLETVAVTGIGAVTGGLPIAVGAFIGEEVLGIIEQIQVPPPKIVPPASLNPGSSQTSTDRDFPDRNPRENKPVAVLDRVPDPTRNPLTGPGETMVAAVGSGQLGEFPTKISSKQWVNAFKQLYPEMSHVESGLLTTVALLDAKYTAICGSALDSDRLLKIMLDIVNSERPINQIEMEIYQEAISIRVNPIITQYLLNL